MSEKVIIITGANRGVGKETARELGKIYFEYINFLILYTIYDTILKYFCVL